MAGTGMGGTVLEIGACPFPVPPSSYSDHMQTLTGQIRLSGKRTPMFGTRLREMRDAAGLSQHELAARAGISLSIVCKIEQGGRVDPRISTLLALAAALGTDCAVLVGDVGGTTQKKRNGRLR